MPHIADTQGILRENLSDAGCDLEMIEQFMTLIQQGNREGGLALLAKHRKRLLDCCHAEQKKLDCLDYLVYQMNRQGKNPPRI